LFEDQERLESINSQLAQIYDLYNTIAEEGNVDVLEAYVEDTFSIIIDSLVAATISQLMSTPWYLQYFDDSLTEEEKAERKKEIKFVV